MADKKKGKKKRRSDTSKGPTPADRRAIERTMLDFRRAIEDRLSDSEEEADVFLKELVASESLPPREKSTALDQAQDLMYDAWEAEGERRIELAREALALSDGCADAYVLLAEESVETLEEARDLYERGVQAGERALSPTAFRDDVGHFWGFLETRPYMRARFGLADCLWMLGERGEAIEHFQEMLRLNPNDNQGVRYLLANYLLEEGDDNACGRLLHRYEDEASAALAYPRALWTFRREGACDKAVGCLASALEQNLFVPRYLLGLAEFPEELPAHMEIGGETEAIAYAAEGLEAWARTPGALEWLAISLPEAVDAPGKA